MVQTGCELSKQISRRPVPSPRVDDRRKEKGLPLDLAKLIGS